MAAVGLISLRDAYVKVYVRVCLCETMYVIALLPLVACHLVMPVAAHY